MFNSINDTPNSDDLKGKKYLGLVVFNDDPLMIERIKVTIPSMFDGQPEELPWVGRNMGGTIPGHKSDGFGDFNLPPRVGSEVTVIFQEGNPLYPMYEAFPIQTDERPEEGKTNYLYRYGRKDPRGNVFFVDTKDDAPIQAYVKLVCGVEIMVSDTGKVSISADDDITVIAKANMKAQVTGNLDLNAQGSASLTSASMVSVNAPAIGMTGPNVSLSASGQVSINAPSVKIN